MTPRHVFVICFIVLLYGQSAPAMTVTTHSALLSCLSTDGNCEIPAYTTIVAQSSYVMSRESIISGSTGSVIDLAYQYQFVQNHQNVTMVDLEVVNGKTSSGGGFMNVRGVNAFANLTNLRISHMRAGFFGGAIYGQNSNGLLKNVHFFNCSTTSSNGVGAFYVQDLNWRFEDVTFENCTAPSGGARSDTLSFSTWDDNSLSRVVFAGEIKFINGGNFDNPAFYAFSDSYPRVVRTTDIELLSDPEKPAHWSFDNYPNHPIKLTSLNPAGLITFEAETITVTNHRTVSAIPKLFVTAGNLDNLVITVKSGIFIENMGLVYSGNKTTIRVPNGPIVIKNGYVGRDIHSGYGLLTVEAQSFQFKSSAIAVASNGPSAPVVVSATDTFEAVDVRIAVFEGGQSSVVNVTAGQFILSQNSPSTGLFYGATSTAVPTTFNLWATCTSGSCGTPSSPSSAPESGPSGDSPFTALPSSDVGFLVSRTSGLLLDTTRSTNLNLFAPTSAIVFERNQATNSILSMSTTAGVSFDANAIVFANNSATRGGAINGPQATINAAFQNMPPGSVVLRYNKASTAGCAIYSTNTCPAGVDATFQWIGNEYGDESFIPQTTCYTFDQPSRCYNPWAPPPSSGCPGSPPSDNAVCIDSTWFIPASEWVETYTPPPPATNGSTPVAPPPPIESPVVVVGDATVPEVTVSLNNVASASKTTEGRAFISSESCLVIDTLNLELDEEAVDSIEVKRSTKVNLIESGCEVQTVLTVNAASPKKSCRSFKYEEERGPNSLAVTFEIKDTNCNNWWIILASVLGGVALICLTALLIFKFSSRARAKVQPFHDTNT